MDRYDNNLYKKLPRLLDDYIFWSSKNYKQDKIEILQHFLINPEAVIYVSNQNLENLLFKYSNETIPAYFPMVIEIIIIHNNKLSDQFYEKFIPTLTSKNLGLDTDDKKRFNYLLFKLSSRPNIKNSIQSLLSTQRYMSPPTWIGSCDIGKIITPDNIAIITSIVAMAIGITKATIEAIRLWIDERKSRSIKIKYKDIELEKTSAK